MLILFVFILVCVIAFYPPSVTPANIPGEWICLNVPSVEYEMNVIVEDGVATVTKSTFGASHDGMAITYTLDERLRMVHITLAEDNNTPESISLHFRKVSDDLMVAYKVDTEINETQAIVLQRYPDMELVENEYVVTYGIVAGTLFTEDELIFEGGDEPMPYFLRDGTLFLLMDNHSTYKKYSMQMIGEDCFRITIYEDPFGFSGKPMVFVRTAPLQ